jgi:DNA-binding response OmpR family regulator
MLDHKRIVLIVEDSEDCSEALELALHSLKGIEVRVVHSAEDALDRLSKVRVAALITDLHLPKMDGLHLVSAMRALKKGRTPPVVMVSGDSDPRTPARALEAGAQAFFSKPYSPAAIRRKLEELLFASEGNGHGSAG